MYYRSREDKILPQLQEEGRGKSDMKKQKKEKEKGRRGMSLPVGTAACVIILSAALCLLEGCAKGPQAGTVYGPSGVEDEFYLDLDEAEAREAAEEDKELPQIEIADSGYTITQIDESDVYPPKKTDDDGNRLPAYLVDFAVRLSNKGNDRALIRPLVTVEALDSYGNTISTSTKTILTYILPDDEIAFASDMTVRGEEPAEIRFYAEGEDPEVFYPTEEELDMPASDQYRTGDIQVRVLPDYEDTAPTAGRTNSVGLSKGYFRFGEVPELSGTISCTREEDREAFVTVLYMDDDRILGGETGRVRIPAGKDASFVLSAAAPIPEGTDRFEVQAFSIAQY